MHTVMSPHRWTVGSTYNCMYRDGMGQTISTTAPLCNVGAAGSDTTGTLGRHMAVFQYLQGGRIGHIHLTGGDEMNIEAFRGT
jgi:hypothetical protein